MLLYTALHDLSEVNIVLCTTTDLLTAISCRIELLKCVVRSILIEGELEKHTQEKCKYNTDAFTWLYLWLQVMIIFSRLIC